MSEIISFKNTSIAREGIIVLSQVNFTVEKGEFVYLIGKVGSGKSSIIKTLNAEIPLYDGEVYVNGFAIKDIASKKIPSLRKSMGVVFQDFQLLTDRSIYDNLLFVLKATGWTNKKEITARINEVLQEVALLDKAKKMPHQLSGGEQQRVVIARALLNHPNLILADEPTGNLDPETSNNIMNLLKSLSEKGKTIVMATHNYNLLERFPARILLCERGRVIEKDAVDRE